MLSVALLICIVWNLGHGDINFRSFKEEKNKSVAVAVPVHRNVRSFKEEILEINFVHVLKFSSD